MCYEYPAVTPPRPSPGRDGPPAVGRQAGARGPRAGAAGFNAPVAGRVFVTEEIRGEFESPFVSLESVIVA